MKNLEQMPIEGSRVKSTFLNRNPCFADPIFLPSIKFRFQTAIEWAVRQEGLDLNMTEGRESGKNHVRKMWAEKWGEDRASGLASVIRISQGYCATAFFRLRMTFVKMPSPHLDRIGRESEVSDPPIRVTRRAADERSGNPDTAD